MNCARPVDGGVCGHDYGEHNTYCLHREPPTSAWDTNCGRGGMFTTCPCTGFRTKDEQEAWGHLRRVFSWDQASPEGKLGEMETAVQCLLELYP